MQNILLSTLLYVAQFALDGQHCKFRKSVNKTILCKQKTPEMLQVDKLIILFVFAKSLYDSKKEKMKQNISILDLITNNKD